MGNHVVFKSCGGILELQREIQTSSCVGPVKTNLPFELRGRDGCCSRVTVGQNRPHLGFCPGHNVPLQGQQGSRGCIPDSPEVRPHLEGKQSTLLSSQVATGISWSPLSGLKGVKPPVELLESTRDNSRHWKKRNASSRDDGENLLFFFSCCTTCGVSLELRWETQGASRVAPGKSSLHSSCEGERGIALESRQENWAS